MKQKIKQIMLNELSSAYDNGNIENGGIIGAEKCIDKILNLFDVIKRLNDACFYGEVEIYQGCFLWEYESPETENVEDDLWDANCIDADAIRKEGFETTGSWANKNKAGFEIIVP